MRTAFVFDPDRCTSCEACRVACGIENNGGRDTGWRTILTFNPSRHPALPTRHLSLACNHCETAPCASGCPASAYSRDETTGAVLLDPSKCIGCRYCSWLCPYDAPKFDEERGVMTKCTFCAPRVGAGGQPACTAACPTAALSFAARDRGDDDSTYHGLGAFGLGPSLRIVKSRHDGPPLALAIDQLVLGAPVQPLPPRKITAVSEWALLLFTIVMPALAAWLAGGMLRAERMPSLIAFGATTAIALALSMLHLGRPLRAWRAVLNMRTSWLSREIAFATAFAGFGVAYLALPRFPRWAGAGALIAAAALVVSIDQVYRAIPHDRRERMHSADATLTFVFLFGIAAGAPIVTISAALVKAVLSIGRWRSGDFGLAAWLRVLLLAVASLPSIAWSAAFAVALVGEAIDRAAFYNELEPTTPAMRMVSEVCAASSSPGAR